MLNTKKALPVNKCQYWKQDEPSQCDHWDNKNTICTFLVEEVVNRQTIAVRAPLFPLCNYIGTASYKCNFYTVNKKDQSDSITTSPRCILPDPYRHVSKTAGCNKWVQEQSLSSKKDKSGNNTLVKPLDYTPINGYNKGLCDYTGDADKSGGTLVTCSGFSPQHTGFSTNPHISECRITTVSGTTAILPMNYSVLNLRAQLGVCMWWGSNPTEFKLELNATKTNYDVKPPTFGCTNTSSRVTEFSAYAEDIENKFIRPPCNGATPLCPKYTGTLSAVGSYLPYLSNVFLRDGDKVLAEQILEIRYNIRKNKWKEADYKSKFGDDSIIYTNTPETPTTIVDSSSNIVDYSINSVKTHISDFKCFLIEYKPVILTKGTATENDKSYYPDLIKSLGTLQLRPIIHSVFDIAYNNNDVGSASTGTFIFETADVKHVELAIVGESFFMGSTLFAINITDPENAFPWPQLFNFDSMLDYSNSIGINYDIFYSKVVCYFDILKIVSPNKIKFNELLNSSGFIVGAETFFGENKIMVFDEGSGTLEFDSIKVRKVFCGGIIAQTDFEVSQQTNEVESFIDYTEVIGRKEYPAKITYEFKPFNEKDSRGTEAYYTYVDSVLGQIKSYKYYKVKVLEETTILGTACDSTSYNRIYLLGNSGHMLVVIDDNNRLHSVIRPWDFGTTQFNVSGLDATGNTVSIEMKVVEKATGRLENNQMIIKPKNNDYVRLYGLTLTIKGGIFVYERYSFGEEPLDCISYEEISDGTSITYVLTKVSSGKNRFTISLPMLAVTPAVVFKGKDTGRIKGQAKTEALVWVRQPYCSDVEIMYSWSASYKIYHLYPDHMPLIDRISLSYQGTQTRSYSPCCGDHDFTPYSSCPKPMWYPYVSCDMYANYRIHTLNEGDNAPMEMWIDADGNLDLHSSDHNSLDLRMLGPADNIGYAWKVHTIIWDCTLDWSYANDEKVGDSWFSGYARIRSGVSGYDYIRIIRYGGAPPRFGNKDRPYLTSYLSSAYLPYYLRVDTENGSSYTARSKWMPVSEGFTDLGNTNGHRYYPWRTYFNGNDNEMTFTSQAGLLFARSSIEGIYISEKIQKNAGIPSRFRFDEVFKTHAYVAKMPIAYPDRRIKMYVGADSEICAWYTYKDVPGSLTTGKSIQWAWREYWKQLERSRFKLNNTFFQELNFSLCDLSVYMESYLSFINFSYINYTFDLTLREFRRVTAEGEHTLSWEPSIYDERDPLPTYFILRLDNGPLRVFDSKCNLIINSADVPSGVTFSSASHGTIVEAIDFYNICSTSEWFSTVYASTDIEPMDNASNGFILYDSTAIVTTDAGVAKSDAESLGQMLRTYEDDGGVGKQKYYYYNTGLIFDVLSNRLKYLPKKETVVPKASMQFSLSARSHDTTQFSVITVGSWYIATLDFGMTYNSFRGADLTIKYKFDAKKIVSKVEVTYLIGKDVTNDSTKATSFYNYPEVKVNKIKNQVQTVISEDVFKFADKSIAYETVTYKVDVNNLTYMSELFSQIAINFRYRPNESDFKADKNMQSPPLYTHLMYISAINIYTTEYAYVEEKVTVYERKFNISTGSFGDYPAHGTDDTHHLLCVDPEYKELSSVQQWDNDQGMFGMPNSYNSFKSGSKLRNRIAEDIQPDMEAVDAGTVADLELKQKEKYDAVVALGNTSFYLNSDVNSVYSQLLVGTSVTKLPDWSCTFTNNTLVPLKSVESKQKYSPLGHNYFWDPESFSGNPPAGHCPAPSFGYNWGRLAGKDLSAFSPSTYATITSHSADKRLGGFNYMGEWMGYVI